ncbi:Fcf1-domain-containing protein [Daldinia caldariorum]|uniref:Fcf1-domain-containing protein n=1 Tax=Daldinia caldariorum TaxID=326644 RepID=UPI0020086FA4|nr:Fcf1-domain-containing protein [Daldinia caldariorum]KAI1467625.1 Fcf1-domain-containing protein [Daldinia caldariorum]
MPRAKRSKQYRKLMEQFSMSFGFREPYQVIVDADFIAEANKCKMDVMRRLEDTLHGQVKPLITQCSMRHLYGRKSEPGVEAAIEQAKNHFERRRCGHHPDEYPEPLSALECLQSVVDPKSNGVNKHRYVCAVNDETVRAKLRQVAGTPLIFIRRSVMIMEPMATVSVKIRSKDEKSKFRAELKTPDNKRKREDDDSDEEDAQQAAPNAGEADKPRKKKKAHGPKEPNPLAVKKKKSKPNPNQKPDNQNSKGSKAEEAVTTESTTKAEVTKRKRLRKHKGKGASTNSEAAAASGDGDGEANAADTKNQET